MYPGKWAADFPEKPAAIRSDTGEVVTYRELNEQSNRLARCLWDRGLRPGDHAAVFMENDLHYFEVVWAAFRSGLYITPINRYLTDEEAGYIVRDCGAKALITSKYLAAVAGALPALAPACQHRFMLGGVVPGFESYEEAIARYPASHLDDEPTGQFMHYSSGTTGRPKGIYRPMGTARIHQDPGVGEPMRVLWGFNDQTVYLSPAPLYHSGPIGFCIATHVLGGTVIMMPRFDAAGALDAIHRYRVTHSQWVPTMFTRLLKLTQAERSGYDLSSHRVAIHAAAPCPQGVKQQMIDWWGPILYEYYGGSELNGLTHCNSQEWLAHPGTVGRSVVGTLHICDEEGREVPNGTPGAVYFEMPALAFEYHRDKEKTLSALHPRHRNWSTLGDIGYVDADGFLHLTDRLAFMIISGGVNIYPQEIENQLIMHPKVADVAVIGVPDAEMGEAVKAVVQPVEGAIPGKDLEAELLGYIREHIAHYKCPKSVDFMAELPRLPTGKLYKRLIRDRYWAAKA